MLDNNIGNNFFNKKNSTPGCIVFPSASVGADDVVGLDVARFELLCMFDPGSTPVSHTKFCINQSWY